MTKEFGKGLTYCLGLFLTHAERKHDVPGVAVMDSAEMWFNGASDHLYDLVIPENFPQDLKDRLGKLQDKAIHWGHGFKIPTATEEDRAWAIFEAKDLLLCIDKHFGIDAEEADFK